MNPKAPVFGGGEHGANKNPAYVDGITIRDHIAIEAMAAMISKVPFHKIMQHLFPGDLTTNALREAQIQEVSRTAYDYADALIAKSKKEND